MSKTSAILFGLGLAFLVGTLALASTGQLIAAIFTGRWGSAWYGSA